MQISNTTLRRGPHDRRTTIMQNVPLANQNSILVCTNLPRFGLRGSGTADWATANGILLPANVNQATKDIEGKICARLGNEEILCLPEIGTSGQNITRIHDRWKADPVKQKGFDAYRDEDWCWIVLSGPDTRTAMRMLTTVDLDESLVLPLQVVQTRAVHMDAVLIRTDRFSVSSFDLFLDISSTDFILDVLSETCPSFELGQI